jgi:succinate dehydrogenase/fumarate reductase flavoprotein subunit
VQRFNLLAAAGRDDDFHRGDSAYDRYYGDPTVTPNPCPGPVDSGPFYALQVVPGGLGTCGGVRADGLARALRPDGSVIEGLYAAGNAAGNAFGRVYPGPGQIVSTFAGAARRTTSAYRALPANTPTAPESTSSQRTWSGDEVSSTGTVTAPAAQMAKSQVTQSRLAAARRPIRSPGRMPSATRPAATAATRLANSAAVTGSHSLPAPSPDDGRT